MRYLGILLITVPLLGFTQSRCGLDAAYFESRTESIKEFEHWMDSRARLRRFETQKTVEVYQIPVVFHVIHAGEAVGMGSNLSEERLIEQIDILNQDFRRLNADTTSIPAAFKEVSSDVEIEFVLAKRDPEGLPSDGIVRKQGSRVSYSLNQDDETLKAESYWPGEEYLNIYVAELSGFVGWAQFPFSDVEGIQEIKSDRLTDGIAIDFQYVGVNLNTGGSFESFGRTATHEIGHYLGLRHLWGDVSGCGGSDYCADTPQQGMDYAGSCPGTNQETCDSPDMYSNFLNYTDDACMNIFTHCQKQRMRLILENAPRRYTLINSPALTDPVQVTNDLGVRKILSPSLAGCTNGFSPTIEVRNYGTNNIVSFEVTLMVDGEVTETVSRSVNLSPLQTTIVNFGEIDEITAPETNFSFVVSSVNTTSDNNDENDMAQILIPLVEIPAFPFQADFENEDPTTSRTFSGSPSNWKLSQAPYLVIDNQAMSIDLADPPGYGEFDFLITPVFDLSVLNSAEFSFNYAYGGSDNPWNKDGLIVAVSTDCGETFPRDQYLFEKYGDGLETFNAPMGTSAPGTPEDWFTESFNITSYAGNEDVRIALIGINNGGNVLYIDDIALTPTVLNAFDIGISGLAGFPVISCSNTINVSLDIRNYGFQVIEEFTLNYASEQFDNELILADLQMNSGDIVDIQFPLSNLENGTYTVTFEVLNPNNQADEQLENNLITRQIVIDNSEDFLPLRQDFENGSDWTLTSPVGAEPVLIEIEGNNTFKADAFDNQDLGTQYWLVSPTLKTGDFDSLGVFFDYAYRSRPGATDRLQVLLSNSCGNKFEFLLYDKTSADLASESASDSFLPGIEDWKKDFVDLSEFTIWPEIRLAWVFTNGNGNNLYLDNIEFTNTRNPDLLSFDDMITIFPNPASGQFFNVVLDLPERQDVNISLVDLTGRLITEFRYPNGLNQTLSFRAPSQSGFYFIRVIGKKVSASQRVFIRR